MNTSIVAVPAAYSLESWSVRPWRDGVQLETMTRLDTLQVRTRNTTYEITVIDPHTGEVTVRGGPFFPQHARAVVAGSSLGGSFIKLRGIYVGFSLEILYGGKRIVTTGVRTIGPGPAPTIQ